MTLLLTPAEWEPICNIKVYDPDGWDRKDFEASWAKPISEMEFHVRAAESTVSTYDSHLARSGATA
jgi:hypothetical protein